MFFRDWILNTKWGFPKDSRKYVVTFLSMMRSLPRRGRRRCCCWRRRSLGGWGWRERPNLGPSRLWNNSERRLLPPPPASLQQRICIHANVKYWNNSDSLSLPLKVSAIRHTVGVQIWVKRRALGCEKFQPVSAWLLPSKTVPPFSPSLYSLRNFRQMVFWTLDVLV